MCVFSVTASVLAMMLGVVLFIAEGEDGKGEGGEEEAHKGGAAWAKEASEMLPPLPRIE